MDGGKNFPAGIYMFKVNNGNSRTRCERCSKLTIKTPERRHWRRSGVLIVNFEHISQLVLVFLLLTLNMQMPTGTGFFRSSSSEELCKKNVMGNSTKFLRKQLCPSLFSNQVASCMFATLLKETPVSFFNIFFCKCNREISKFWYDT